ncbi:MAG: glycosyltransferase family 39 protein [Ignavibacteriae bacterium]|nr:glycosyltransferase family 39 protein [Ignavibacteria bacterium]MBI3365587.1 glycosyltransferase family 39 protein [Ignavibacteriota bacterium]
MVVAEGNPNHTHGGLRTIRAEYVVLFLVVALGFGLRIWNIGWGLPELFEEATPLVKSWKMWKWGSPGIDLNPHFFNYPGFTFYLQFIVQAINYFVGHLFGLYSSLESFGMELSSILLPARIVTLLFDIGTIIVTYKLGKEYSSPAVGLVAAAFVAVNPLHVLQAHYVTVDTPLTFFTVLALLYIHRISIEPKRKWYIRTGFSIGLAAATKYTGAVLLLVLLVVQFLRAGTVREKIHSLKSKDLGISLFTAAYIFIALNPYLFLSFSEFWRDFSYEQHHAATGHLGLDVSQTTPGYYLLEVFPQYLGWLLYGFFLLMTIFASVQRDRKLGKLLFFPLVYFLVVGSWEMRAERYILPIIPIVLLISAIGIVQLWERIVDRGMKRMIILQKRFSPAATLVGLCTLVIIQPVAEVYKFERTIALPNTRTIARKWIEQHFAQGAAIATGAFGIQLPESLYNLIKIPFRVVDAELESPFYDTRWYDEVDLLIASDYDYDRYVREPERYRDILPFYDSLRARWTLAVEIKPTEGQTGPTFWLYSPPHDGPARFDSSLIVKLHSVEDSARVGNFLNELGIVLIRKNSLPRAEQILRELVSAEEGNLEARNALAKILFDQQRYLEALQHLAISLASNPNQADVLDLAGRALLALNKHREAEAVLQRAIALNHQQGSSYETLFELYVREKNMRMMGIVLREYLATLTPGSKKFVEVAKKLEELDSKANARSQ